MDSRKINCEIIQYQIKTYKTFSFFLTSIEQNNLEKLKAEINFYLKCLQKLTKYVL